MNYCGVEEHEDACCLCGGGRRVAVGMVGLGVAGAGGPAGFPALQGLEEVVCLT